MYASYTVNCVHFLYAVTGIELALERAPHIDLLESNVCWFC